MHQARERGVSPLFSGLSLGKDLQKPLFLPTCCPTLQGMKCTLPSGSRNTTGRSLGSAASGARASCIQVILSCRVSQLD